MFLLEYPAGGFSGDAFVGVWGGPIVRQCLGTMQLAGSDRVIDAAGDAFEDKFVRPNQAKFAVEAATQKAEDEKVAALAAAAAAVAAEAESPKKKKKGKKGKKGSKRDSVGSKKERSRVVPGSIVESDDTRGGHNASKQKATLEDIDAILTKNVAHDDHYEVLGLGHLRRDANDDEIRNAHRALSLMYHPDKARQKIRRKLAQENKELSDEALAEKEAEHIGTVEAKFKRIMTALDVLSDDKKRQAFDSAEETMDIKTPSDKMVDEGDFFTVLRPVFQRYAYFSKQKPVPSLGNAATPIETVTDFYDFWWGFQSWRDFSHEDEHNPEEGEYREEKRWMERENEKVRKKKMSQEANRIRDLVDMAYKKDPRVIQMKKDEAAAKEAARLLKQAEKLAREEAEAEAAKKAEEEAAAVAVEEEEKKKAEKKQREKERKEKQKSRSRLRKACDGTRFDMVDVEVVLGDLAENPKALQALAAVIEAGKEGGEGSDAMTKSRDMWDTAVLVAKKVVGATTVSAEKAKNAADAPGSHLTKEQKYNAFLEDWSEVDVNKLTKAVLRYPPGTRQRWDKISQFVETKSPDEVVEMVKLMKNEKLSVKTTTNDDGTSVSRVTIANTKVDMSKENKPQVDNTLATAVKVSTPKQYKVEVKKTAAKAPEEAQKPAPAKEAVVATVASAPAPEKKKSDGPPMEGWSTTQQVQLEKAMKTYGAKVEERWTKIAAEVEGQTKGSCIRHYKELVLYYKALKKK